MTPYLLAIGLCLGALEEPTGLPSWQLEVLRRELVQACRDEPFSMLRRIRGGRLFAPTDVDRRRGEGENADRLTVR